MRNKEGYIDSTAGKAMNPTESHQRLKSITAPPIKKYEKRETKEKKFVYYSVPVYTSK